MALKDNLIALWGLSEASGDAIDAHSTHGGVETSGTIDAASGPGDLAGARDFEAGDTERFVVSDHADLDTGDIDWSVAGWVQLESDANGTIISKWTTTGNQREYRLAFDTSVNNAFILEVTSDGAAASLVTLAASTFGMPSTGVWYYLAAGHNASTNELWISVNAGTPDTVSYSAGLTAGTSVLTLGANAGGGIPWDGLLAQLGFWKRDIRSDLAAIYNSGDGLLFSAWDAGGGTFTATIAATIGAVNPPAQRPRLTPHPSHVWPIGVATAEAAHVDAWQQPYREPVRPPVRLVPEPRWCGVLEPSLFTAPPGVSWWEQASEPVRVRQPLVQVGDFGRGIDLGFVPPPGQGWGVPLEVPTLRPASPIRGGETRVDIVEAAEEVTVGWDRAAELPVRRGPALPGHGVGIIEQTLFTAPPELSWFQPASEPVRTKPPPRWQWATLIVGVNLTGYVSTATIGKVVESEIFVSAMARGQMFTPGAAESEIKQS